MQLRSLKAITPGTIILLAAALSVVMIVSAAIELQQSKRELYHLMSEQALSLVETVDQSSANIILSTERIEESLAERLFNNAYFIAKLDSAGMLTGKELRRIAAANSIFRINIIDKNGVKILGNTGQDVAHKNMKEQRSPRETLKPILDGTVEKMVIGLREPRFEAGQRFIVAVRRTGPAQGAIVLNLNAGAMLELRRTIGIGKLMKDLGDNAGIVYAILQDQQGVLAAGGTVNEISSLAADPAVQLCADRDTTITRTVSTAAGEIFEVIRHFTVAGTSLGVFRIGFSMDEIHATEARMLRRMIFMSLILLTIGLIVAAAIIALQNYSSLGKKYAVMQTMTGKILERMSDAVIAVNSAGVITVFNKEAERLFSPEAQSRLGSKIDEFNDPTAQCLQKIFSASDENELELQCGNGIRYVSVAISESGEGEEGVIRTAVVRDRTDTRVMEREMTRREKLTAMGELASGVAHEIRNPLNAIAMVSQRLLSEFSPRNGAKEYRMLAGVLQSEAKRMNGIIQQFLRFSRPPDLRIGPIAILPFLDHFASLCSPLAGEKGIVFTVAHHGAQQWMFDREQMTQAILNLLQNALDATDRGGSIILRAEENDAACVFSVTDTGKGISPEEREKIFNLYFTTKQHGTGLGLAFVHQIAAQHNGRIDLNSVPGSGTTFSIILPPVRK
ncbi:MAG TPA: ATP-binding protein [Bacteroidota bacterium]|nr:ATP-binding protein [Bacteroidota bacterium]